MGNPETTNNGKILIVMNHAVIFTDSIIL